MASAVGYVPLGTHSRLQHELAATGGIPLPGSSLAAVPAVKRPTLASQADKAATRR